MTKVKKDVVGDVHRRTGLSLEDIYSFNGLLGKPSLTTSTGQLNIEGYTKALRSVNLDNGSIARGVADLTGTSFESALIKINMPKIT